LIFVNINDKVLLMDRMPKPDVGLKRERNQVPDGLQAAAENRLIQERIGTKKPEVLPEPLMKAGPCFQRNEQLKITST
jgi:hypothetical protein